MAANAIFAPYQLGKLSLKSRIVMAPLTRSRSNEEGVPPTYAAEYYSQRASAGLIIAEATNISSQARGYAKTPGIWSDAQVEAWKPITEAVHKAGGVFFLQLWHTGRISHPSLQPEGRLPVAPSAVKPEGQAFTNQGMQDHVTPRALETHELPGIVEDYRRAARNAKAAGFDGVEVHSANSYFLDQFLRDSTNLRTDEYGGSVENRLRFPLEAVRAVIDGFGDVERVAIRISPGGTQPGGTPLDSNPNVTYGQYVEELSKLGLIYLHVIEGTPQQTREVPNHAVDYQLLHRLFSRTFMDNNMLTLEMAEEQYASKAADLFAFGRPYIANPDLVERLRDGLELAPEAAKDTWYGGDEHGYTDFPNAQQGKLQNA
jgi:N-ethylmaleimide reductase